MRIAAVISTWTGNPSSHLHQLCQSLSQHQPGQDYDLFLSANGLDYSPANDLRRLFKEIFVRENTGFNLGSWNYAWQHLTAYDRFLFLQDDCVVLRNGWLGAFVRRFDRTRNCGLVGETLQYGWAKPWSALCSPEPMDRRDRDPVERAAWAQFVRKTLAGCGITEGSTGRHITTVVQFTSRSILEQVKGFNIGETKQEAIAAEIGFSRKIEALGYVLVQVARRRHSVIGHRQWPKNTFFARLRRSIVKRLPSSHENLRCS